VDQAEYVFYREHHTELGNVLNRARFPEAKALLDSIKNSVGTILEVGCASGSITIHVSRNSPKSQVVGMDIDKVAVRQARRATRHLNLLNTHYIVASATHFPIRSSAVDCILCQEVIEHIPSPAQVLAESGRVLNATGKILLTTPITKVAPLSPDWFETRLRGSLSIDEFAMHLYRFNPNSLTRSIERNGFEIKQIQLTNQYLEPFLVFVLTLWKKHNLQREKTKNIGAGRSQISMSGLPNVVVMLCKTIEFRLFRSVPVGSNIIVNAQKRRANH
jgi:ubiquinone/menaquinone biosynthesis C-methylase UbiE